MTFLTKADAQKLPVGTIVRLSNTMRAADKTENTIYRTATITEKDKKVVFWEMSGQQGVTTSLTLFKFWKVELLVLAADIEYRLTFADDENDPRMSLGNVAGPVEHAIDVWESRTNPENEGYYGPDVLLQQRGVQAWETIRRPE